MAPYLFKSNQITFCRYLIPLALPNHIVTWGNMTAFCVCLQPTNLSQWPRDGLIVTSEGRSWVALCLNLTNLLLSIAAVEVNCSRCRLEWKIFRGFICARDIGVNNSCFRHYSQNHEKAKLHFVWCWFLDVSLTVGYMNCDPKTEKGCLYLICNLIQVKKSKNI